VLLVEEKVGARAGRSVCRELDMPSRPVPVSDAEVTMPQSGAGWQRRGTAPAL